MDSTHSISQDLKTFLLADSVKPIAIIIKGRQKVRLEKNTVRFLTTANHTEGYIGPLVKKLEGEDYRFVFLTSKENPDMFAIKIDCASSPELIDLSQIKRLLILKEKSITFKFDFLEDFELQFSSILDTIAIVQSIPSHSNLKVVCYDFASHTQFQIPHNLIVGLPERA